MSSNVWYKQQITTPVYEIHTIFSFCGATALMGPRPPCLFYRSHTIRYKHTHTHTWQDSFQQVISLLQRPLPTHHTTIKRDEHSAELEPAIPGIQKLQNYVVARTATGIGTLTLTNRFKYTDLSLNYQLIHCNNAFPGSMLSGKKMLRHLVRWKVDIWRHIIR